MHYILFLLTKEKKENKTPSILDLENLISSKQKEFIFYKYIKTMDFLFKSDPINRNMSKYFIRLPIFLPNEKTFKTSIFFPSLDKNIEGIASIFDNIFKFSYVYSSTISNKVLSHRIDRSKMWLNPPKKNMYPLINNWQAGKAKYLLDFRKVVNTIAGTNSNLTICGESGTERKATAIYIHRHSSRSSYPIFFIDENNFNIEAFLKKGTIVLIEPFKLPDFRKKKILQLLTSKKVRSNEDLLVVSIVEENLFSNTKIAKKLKQKLEEYKISCPTVRGRSHEDFLLLLNFYTRYYARKFNKSIKGYDDQALKILMAYQWPHNVKELKNSVKISIRASKTNIIRKKELYLSSNFQKFTNINIFECDLTGIIIDKKIAEQARKIIKDIVTKNIKKIKLSFVLPTTSIGKRKAIEAGYSGTQELGWALVLIWFAEFWNEDLNRSNKGALVNKIFQAKSIQSILNIARKLKISHLTERLEKSILMSGNDFVLWMDVTM